MSRRSTVRVIVDHICGTPAHVLNVVHPQAVTSSHSQFEPARNKNVKGAAPAGLKRAARLNSPLPWKRQVQSPFLQVPRYSHVTVHHAGFHGTRSASSKSSRSDPSDILLPFRTSMAAVSSENEGMDKAWEAFEHLRTSHNLPLLPDHELLEFIPRAFKTSTFSIDPPVIVPKDTAALLGRLHDEILRRVKPSAKTSPFRVWLDVLAVQTLLTAGKLEKTTQMLIEKFNAPKRRAARPSPRSLEQLFIASIVQESLEAGLSVLVKFWPWIQRYFDWYQPVGNGDDIDKLRRSVSFAFQDIAGAKQLVGTTSDKATLEVGASILAFKLCTQAPWDKIRAIHTEFVTCELPMPLGLHMQFFKCALAEKEYPRALAIRGFMESQFTPEQLFPEVEPALESLPKIFFYGQSFDPLAWQADCTTMDRFNSCIKDPRKFSDLRLTWEEMEITNCHTRRRLNDRPIVPSYDLRLFAKAVIDNSCAKPGDLVIPNSRDAIHILEQISPLLEQRYAWQPDGSSIKVNPVVWHAMLLKGEIASVRNGLLREKKGHLPDRIRTITQLFLTVIRLHSLAEAFEHIVPLWPMLIRHLEDAGGRFTTRETAEQGARLREAIFKTFRAIKEPVAWITESLKEVESREKAVHLFCLLFREYEDNDKALQLLGDLQERALPFGFHSHMVLLKTFLPDHIDVANRVHRSFCNTFPQKVTVASERSKEELHLGLRLFSLQGDVDRAEEYYGVMKSQNMVDNGVRRRVMRAYAVNGDTEQTRRLFIQFFGGRINEPTIRDFREIIYAHVRAGDMQGINLWLEQMLQRGIKPDISIYNMILLALANSLDLDSAVSVLQRMRESDVQPNVLSYSTVMSIMSENKDPIAAEQLYTRAVEEGVVPDDPMIFTLMNAHVEAGSWKGVIRAFDYLQLQKRSTRLNAQLYNVLLKAYVLIGAPFQTVYDVFRRFGALGMTPTAHTYSLLLQAACDARRMDTARDLFVQLEARAKQEGNSSYINVYAMTILMAGFLRTGQRQLAQGVYDDMVHRGIQPRAHTFAIIIRSYANEKSEESLRIAEEFMRSLFSAGETQRAWMGATRGGRAQALNAVYAPLMRIYGRELDVTAVEKLYDEMLARGGHPNVTNLTLLMDAYRRVNNLEGVQHIWGEVFAFAKQIAQNDPFAQLSPVGVASAPMPGGDGRPPLRQANILCTALSVYIQALSEGAQHLEIARTWRAMKENGFAFDAHNWNHLATALVRAGEVERAMEIVERVILPYQRSAYIFKRERRKATTPLTFLAPEAQVEAEAEAAERESGEFPLQPARQAEHRTSPKAQGVEWEVDLTPVGEEDDVDVAQQLHELQQLTLTWQAWRPHARTLDALNGALQRLEAGLRVRPEGVALSPEEDVQRMDDAAAREAREIERREVARILHRIHVNYPQTLQSMEERKSKLDSMWRDEEEKRRSYS